MKPKPVKPPPIYYGRPTLKDRGWTDALVARFLPEPDTTAVNPHFRCAAPRKLYLITRVEAIEATDAWQIAKRLLAPKRRAAKAAVATKQANMERHLGRVRFKVPMMDREILIKKACDSYNWRQAERAERRGDWDGYDRSEPATPQSSPAFLERIAVNWLRHETTRYENELDDVRGKVGVGMAYGKIVTAVLDAIAEVYPWLSDECQRQKAARVTGESKP